MIAYRRSIVTALLLMFCAGCAWAPPVRVSRLSRDVAAPSALAGIPLGERLIYGLRWMGLRVGEARVEVLGIELLDGHEVYHVRVLVRSNAVLSKIYPVEDELDSYIDVEGGFSRKFTKQAREGTYRANEMVVYDYVNGVGTYTSLTNGSEKTFDIPGPIQDSLSVLYAVRQQHLEPGKSLVLSVNADEKNWELQVDVLGVESVEIRRLGRWQAMVVEPKAKYQGVFKRKGRMWIWLSADEKRIPLRLKTKVPIVGTIVATLESIEKIDEKP